MNDLLSIDKDIWIKEAEKRNWRVNDGFSSNNIILEHNYRGYKACIDVGYAYYGGYGSMTTRLRIKAKEKFNPELQTKLNKEIINQKLLKLRSGKLYVLEKEIRVESNGVNNKETILDNLIELAEIIIDYI